MNAAKLAYKPFGLLAGIASGAVAGAVFQQVWKRLGHADDAPDATDPHRGWPEILLAAALQGAIFAAVKATVNRGGATAVHRLTGTWPD
ncbi:DUF4235 domain-containing protein [Streptomyces sp. JJ66]|uniref:DUF4235 domain-containing protein n=1 Tax=Streptomyces sp. JJ66 TaxID=2803843 RepID=UPI001C55C8D8|nr:DUF4235 domain-containing protein [Streptomyces sp. JJ66]MBW1604319.1 DUF4235 domain-containing protein [Streptomyces sp. JJ66]